MASAGHVQTQLSLSVAGGSLQRGERWNAGLHFAHVKSAFVLGEKALGREAFHEALNQLMQEDLQLFFSRRRYRSKDGMAINQVIYAVEKKAVLCA